MIKNNVKVALIIVTATAVVFCFLQFSLLDTWQERIFDRFFTKKVPSSEIVIFAIDNESISAWGQWPWSRKIFANALEKLQKATVVAIDVNFSDPSSTDPAGDLLLAAAMKRSVPKVILPLQINQRTQEKIEPLDILKAEGLVGTVNVTQEDGVIRKVENFQNGSISFGALATQQYQGKDIHIPAVMRIDYAGPQNTFTTLPVNDLLQGRVPEAIYRDKIVFIGATAADLHDFSQTPFGLLSGVEINANITNTIISQTFYQDFPWYLSLLAMALFNLASAVSVVKIKRLYLLIFALLGLFVSINVLGMALFSYKIMSPVLYVNGGFLVVSIAAIIFQYLVEFREKRFIYESFKYYLSPEVIQDILKDPKKLALGGERKKITVFFSDIRGFTSASESLSPEMLTYVVSEYMTEMTDIIMAEKGLVSQYFGDGIMAFWGAPLKNANQATDACRAALLMQAALDGLNARFKNENINAHINVGMGINTGEVIAGNIGSRKKFNYTVFGDGVNLTARLEGLNKEYGTNIIISETTRKEVADNPQFSIRELDVIMVKGKKQPTAVFELRTTPLDPSIMRHFSDGRKLYNEGKWKEAIAQFSLIANSDGPSRLYIKRCQEFEDNPPEHWNGIYEFNKK